MNNETPRDLDEEGLKPLPIPSFIGNRTELNSRDATYAVEQSLQDTINQNPDPLANLARLISEPPAAPPIATHASNGMREAFDRVAQEIVSVAQDGVDRANQNLQEAISYADIIRKAGDVLCSRIEAEGVRMLQTSRLMREARTALGEAADPPAPG